MKTKTTYGSCNFPARLAREIQLGWAMVETPAATPRFLNFPCRDVPRTATRPQRANEKRPLAA